MSVNEPNGTQRYINPLDILVVPGYTIEAIVAGLNAPVSMVFDENGNILIGESGEQSGNPRVMRLRDNQYELVAEGFNSPIKGINVLNGDIYVSLKGAITVIKEDGSMQDIITGLPGYGDYSNYRVEFGPDGKMYFGQGSATNSGVVGLDNLWVINHPYFHDFSAEDIRLVGQNFVAFNFLSYAIEDFVFTGAFRPFGFTNRRNALIRGGPRATSCIYRADLDGSNLEIYAWGIRAPVSIKFDRFNRLYAVNRGFDERGSRPISNSPDELLEINYGYWYGFPDYSGGFPITDPIFAPSIGEQPEFLLENHPMIPSRPKAIIPPHSNASGFDFNYNSNFGPYGDVYLAESGSFYPSETGGYPYVGVGRRIVRINMNNGSLSTFAINRSGLSAIRTNEGGFERPVDVEFGPDGAMYVLDYGIGNPLLRSEYDIPYTGVIWRISRT